MTITSNGREARPFPKSLLKGEETRSAWASDRGEFVQTIHELASSGIGKDPYISYAYSGLLNYEAMQGEESVFIPMMQIARVNRSPEGNPTNQKLPLRRIHAALLLLYGLNDIFINTLHDENYPITLELDSPEQWKQRVFAMIANNQDLLAQLEHTLENFNLITSSPERSNDMPLILSRVFGDMPVEVADLGSSMGFPWLRHLSGEGADDLDPLVFADGTFYNGEKGLFQRAAKERRPKLRKVKLYDHDNPWDNIPFFIANRYPKDVTPVSIRKTAAQIARYTPVPGYEFHQHNMLSAPDQPHTNDVVSVMMGGYELPSAQQQTLINDILPAYVRQEGVGGLQIVKDYIQVDRRGNLKFVDDRKSYTCATAVRGNITGNRWMVVTRSETSRFKNIIAGEHFSDFMKATEYSFS